MSEHNAWLAWKMKRGLAARGRPGPFHPTGVLATILYHVYFKHHEPVREETGAIIFTQDVGGTLGPSGKTNGE